MPDVNVEGLERDELEQLRLEPVAAREPVS